MSDHTQRLREMVERTGAHIRTDEPMTLASGYLSRDFIDGKLAVSEPEDLALVGEAMVAAAREADVRFDAVGGLVLGAVPYTFAVAQAAGCRWFLVRKEPKGRGTNRYIEGARLTPGTPVMLVDDVVTTGGSIQQAYQHLVDEGVDVVFASTLVDRSDVAADFFARHRVPYAPLLTYRDLGIEPVGPGVDGALAVR